MFFFFSISPSTYNTIMSPTKMNLNTSESSRPRKVSTLKKSKAFKQRKIPKALEKWHVISLLVYLIAYHTYSLYVRTEPRLTISLTATQRKSCSPNLPLDPKTSHGCYDSIKPRAVSVSLAPSNLHVTNPQDRVNLASNFPPANFEIPVSTRV